MFSPLLTVPKYPRLRAASLQANNQAGISLIEIMISLVIGLIVIGGIFTLLTSSRISYSVNQDQAYMLDAGRFALHVLNRDLRQAGGYGRSSSGKDITGVLPAVTGDCAVDFYADFDHPVFGFDQETPFGSTCISADNHRDNTDILVVRYANPSEVADDATLANTIYVQGYLSQIQIFVGGNPSAVPTIHPNNNFPLRAHVYYVHNDTEPGDGIPSLRRIALTTGSGGAAKMIDETLASGIENFQVQYGVNNCTGADCGKAINRYVDAGESMAASTALFDAQNIQTVRVWVLARSEGRLSGVDTSGTYSMGGNDIVIANDGFRRQLFSGVFLLRNLSASGG